MKIQAKDLKVGDEIKDGIWTMHVEIITNDVQKNGTPLVSVEGKASRRNSKSFRRRLGEFVYQNENQQRVYKELTFVNVH